MSIRKNIDNRKLGLSFLRKDSISMITLSKKLIILLMRKYSCARRSEIPKIHNKIQRPIRRKKYNSIDLLNISILTSSSKLYRHSLKTIILIRESSEQISDLFNLTSYFFIITLFIKFIKNHFIIIKFVSHMFFIVLAMNYGKSAFDGFSYISTCSFLSFTHIIPPFNWSPSPFGNPYSKFPS